MAIQKTAKDIMTTHVVVTTTSATVAEAGGTLAKNKISGMPVLNEDGRMVGILSQTDMLGPAEHAPVAAVMTRDVVSVAPDMPVGKIAKTLADQAINRVPVIDAAGNLVGIVSRADIVAAVAAEWYWSSGS